MTRRKPQAFLPDDPNLKIEVVPELESIAESETLGGDEETDHPSSAVAPMRSTKSRFGWGRLFLTAVFGLVSLAAGLWVTSFVSGLFDRNDWIGAVALGLLAVAVFAAFMIILREIVGIMRLRRMTRIRQGAERAIDGGSLDDTRRSVKQLRALYQSRKDLQWGLKRLDAHARDVLDPQDLALLAEREILTPLDAEAKRLVAHTARRISVVTAISPAAVVDVAYVAVENMKLLHKIATLYGGRPGASGVFKLARMVLTHLTLTGGVALSSDLIQQFVGQKLTAKLSARLGEGIFNGALAARIGMAAIDICRPLPFIEARPPRIRDFLGELMRGKSKS